MNGTSSLSHRGYQEAVEKLLTYYGFNAKPEHWAIANNKLVRLDVYGTCARKEVCGNATVAVEVSRTSRLEKDLDRVYTVRASYGFVLATKQGLEVPPVSSGNVFVVRSLEELEDRLRELLRVPNDYPRVTAELLARAPKYQDLDEAFEMFGVPAEFRERARKLLLHAHTTCYILYVDYEGPELEQVLEKGGRSYYPVRDEAAYNILHQLGLADITRYRDAALKGYRVVITNEDVARVEAEKYVSRAEEELRKLIETYGWEVALITYADTHKTAAADVPLFLLPTTESWPPEFNRALVSIGALFPLLKDRYQAFWEGLVKLGLAFESSCDQFVVLLPEAREVILELVLDKLADFMRDEELVRNLASLNVLYHSFPLTPDKDGLEGFYRTLNVLGLSLDDLEKASQNLYRKGLVLGFNKDSPPYMIVLDEVKFKEEVVNEIKQFYYRMASGASS